MHFDGTITWEFIGTIVISLLSVISAYYNLKNKIDIASSTMEELESNSDVLGRELRNLKEDLHTKYNLNKNIIHDEIKIEIEELNNKLLNLEKNMKKEVEKIKTEISDMIKDKVNLYEEKLDNIQKITEERLSNTKRELNDKITKIDISMDKELEAIKSLFFRKLDEANANISNNSKDLSNLEIKLEKYNGTSISTSENLKYLTKIVEKNEDNIKLLMENLMFKDKPNT